MAGNGSAAQERQGWYDGMHPILFGSGIIPSVPLPPTGWESGMRCDFGPSMECIPTTLGELCSTEGKASPEILQPFSMGRTDRNEGEATSNGPLEKCLERGSNRCLADTSVTAQSTTLSDPAANRGNVVCYCW